MGGGDAENRCRALSAQMDLELAGVSQLPCSEME